MLYKIQVRSLESLKEQHLKKVAAAAELEHEYNNLQKNHTYLESSLSSETRVKLDLLSALGEAKRKLHIQEGETDHYIDTSILIS